MLALFQIGFAATVPPGCCASLGRLDFPPTSVHSLEMIDPFTKRFWCQMLAGLIGFGALCLVDWLVKFFKG